MTAMADLSISSFDDLLRAARQQPEPQRLLFVFAGAELPDDSTPEQRARFAEGGGGALAPLMCVDKSADELDTFSALVDESRAAGPEWAIVFVAGLAGRAGRAPTSQGRAGAAAAHGRRHQVRIPSDPSFPSTAPAGPYCSNDGRRVKPASGGFALWSLGFRPFYLLASVFAAVSILLWICQYTGHLPAAYIRSPAWHGHEMLYGYTIAVMAGFLLTAVRNWTGMPTPTGRTLMALAALWIAGRVLVLTPFAMAAAVVNAAFPVAIAVAIGIPLVRSRNRRNYFFIALLLLLGAAVLAFHLSALAHTLVARTREPAGGTGCRAVRAGRDGRTRDPDVHQQRRARRAGHAPPVGRRSSRSAPSLR